MFFRSVLSVCARLWAKIILFSLFDFYRCVREAHRKRNTFFFSLSMSVLFDVIVIPVACIFCWLLICVNSIRESPKLLFSLLLSFCVVFSYCLSNYYRFTLIDFNWFGGKSNSKSISRNYQIHDNWETNKKKFQQDDSFQYQLEHKFSVFNRHCNAVFLPFFFLSPRKKCSFIEAISLCESNSTNKIAGCE